MGDIPGKSFFVPKGEFVLKFKNYTRKLSQKYFRMIGIDILSKDKVFLRQLLQSFKVNAR